MLPIGIPIRSIFANKQSTALVVILDVTYRATYDYSKGSNVAVSMREPDDLESLDITDFQPVSHKQPQAMVEYIFETHLQEIQKQILQGEVA